MNIWPLKFRSLPNGELLFADDAGGYFLGDDAFLDRYVNRRLASADRQFLIQQGHAFRNEGDLHHTAYAYRWSLRQSRRPNLSYVVLVPTLRCNLHCGYCQVARADEHARDYDWDASTLASVITFLDALTTSDVKIELQGGEPFLRLDLLETVRRFCRARFQSSHFVVCTNLQHLSDAHWEFLKDDDTSVSTSLDGGFALHQANRTRETESTKEFFHNLDRALSDLGPARVSALPTINPLNPPPPVEIVDAYERYGFRSIYLRPVNFQGFARRSLPSARNPVRWNAYHSEFVDYLVDRNAARGSSIEEYYFSHCLRRIFRPGLDGHVDLRNPSPVASDYIVIDHDGTLYPSDEARMLARLREVDLSIGHVSRSIDWERVSTINTNALNNCDPDCIHCPYQPFCGVDVVDDISRYKRVDVPRHETWFCSRQMAIFDKAFQMIYSHESKIQRALATWLGIESFAPEVAPRLS